MSDRRLQGIAVLLLAGIIFLSTMVGSGIDHVLRHRDTPPVRVCFFVVEHPTSSSRERLEFVGCEADLMRVKPAAATQ